jgi:hypothetical protein
MTFVSTKARSIRRSNVTIVPETDILQQDSRVPRETGESRCVNDLATSLTASASPAASI